MSIEPKTQPFWCEKMLKLCVVTISETVAPREKGYHRRVVVDQEMKWCNRAKECGVETDAGTEWPRCVHPAANQSHSMAV